MQRYLVAAALGFCLVGTIGCGSVKFPDTVPFSGSVTLDGKPLAGAVVVFTPSATTGEGAIGQTDESGKFDLRVVIGEQSKPGVVPGAYKAHISTMLPPPPIDGKVEKSTSLLNVMEEKVPEQYSSFARTTLNVTVPSAGGTHNFDLKGGGGKFKAPSPSSGLPGGMPGMPGGLPGGLPGGAPGLPGGAPK